ncbi:HAD family hydrolase [Clostridium beijerinckii]|uniref:HAD family hydrolase n=1 Tax=Clostridium beijerinckii TaxID=1520 RepID=UPI00098BDFA1|nr:HAD-IA family hydrolase [Clostridium beijerinckii]MBA8934281.1 putative hydrolase of the HAD superfamily [Clostridium beijerinckii]NRT35816.1 putative hydrolase of the HAD superfamily [Clostridium beijerinckii]NRT44758.1 putative hydrolase of the HAD superfamily [Clostridium beijerinckii]NRU38473.1 putative hydrolase of the HAD superfamily [Clostridium beijerinckii]NRZ21250.1 putative hydrolase of the HAD superfamily [Clostridium beijerinckii]
MLKTKNLKAILFDSGRVLNDPRTGHWFIPPNFYKYVDRNKFGLLDRNVIEMVFYKALKYLNQKNFILTEMEELEHFIEFYRIIANELPVLELSNTNIVEIAKDTVYNDEKFLFYEDVFEIIPQLSKNYKLGVISDTWPSLERVFRNAGLRDYFSTFVMSSTTGVIKPNELMFNTALSELNIKPEEAMFIDDSIKNVEGASKLGIESILMVRDKNYKHDTEYLQINTLKDLLTLLQ